MKLAAPLIVIVSVAASLAAAEDGREGDAALGRRSLNLFRKSTKGSKSSGKGGKEDDGSAGKSKSAKRAKSAKSAKRAKGTKSTGSKEAESSADAKSSDGSSSTCGPSERRSWRDMTCDEQSRYLDVVKQLKKKGIWDEFVKAHAQSEIFAHHTAAFLPWHRWFLHKYEEEVRKEGGCDMFLPYWSWEQDAGHECESAVFHPLTFGGYIKTADEECCVDGIVNYMPTEFNPDPVFDKNWASGECLEREFRPCDEDDAAYISFSDEAHLLRLLTNLTQFGAERADVVDGKVTISFAVDLENAPHSGPHNFLGGMMSNVAISPSDPIFFLHHANVDRLWAIWQDFRGHDEVEVKPTSFTTPEYWHHLPGRGKVSGVDEPMTFDCTTATNGEGVDWYQAQKYNNIVPPTTVRCPNVDFTIDGADYPAPWQAYSTNYGPIQVTYKNDLLARLLANFTGDDSWNNPQWIEIAEDTSSATPKCLETSPVQVPEVPPPVPPGDEENCPILSFARPELSADWFDLCEEMLDATLDELLASLNKEDCESRGNPMTASEEWIIEEHGVDFMPDDFDCIFD